MANPFAPPVAEFSITGRLRLADNSNASFTITDDGNAYVDAPYDVDSSAARDLMDVVKVAIQEHLRRNPLPLPGADWRQSALQHTNPPASGSSPAYPTRLGY